MCKLFNLDIYEYEGNYLKSEKMQKNKGGIYKVNHITVANCPRVLNMETSKAKS